MGLFATDLLLPTDKICKNLYLLWEAPQYNAPLQQFGDCDSLSQTLIVETKSHAMSSVRQLYYASTSLVAS